ncbi:hypothetical protein D3C85_1011230 [compost metagenome]
MPSDASSARIRALAEGSDRWLRWAPAVMLPLCTVLTNRRRSIRSKCMVLVSLCLCRRLAQYKADFQAPALRAG